MNTKNRDERWVEILKHPIIKELNPDGRNFLKAHVLSSRLNPYDSEGISMYALTVCGLPHIKAVPAFGMMASDFNRGMYEGKHTIIVPSSGNTAHAVARLASAFGFKKVTIVLPTDVPPIKRAILAALSSVKIIETPGSTMDVAKEEAERDGCYVLDQYNHPDNAKSHEVYTAPAVIWALGYHYKLHALGVSLGSAGTAMGLSRGVKDLYPETKIIGVRPALGEQSPGTRDAKKMEIIQLPWRTSLDALIETGGRKESFIRMRQLWSEVEPQPGPSSGLAFDGLLRYLSGLSDDARQKLRGKQVAFMCPDDGRFYPEYTLGELDVHEGMG